MILIADANGELEWVNKSFNTTTGYTLADYKEKFGKNIDDASTNTNIKSELERCIKEKSSFNYTSNFNSRKGKTIWLQTTITPFLDEDGKILKFIAVDTDITEIKNAQDAIKMQKEEIEHYKNEIESQRDKIKEQGETITSQMEKILESIFYSKKIQNAFLPNYISL